MRRATAILTATCLWAVVALGNSFVVRQGDAVSELVNDVPYITQALLNNTGATNSCKIICTNVSDIAGNSGVVLPYDTVSNQAGTKTIGWDRGGFLDADNSRLYFTSAGVGKYQGVGTATLTGFDNGSELRFTISLYTAGGAAIDTAQSRVERCSSANGRTTAVCPFAFDVTNAGSYVQATIRHDDTGGSGESMLQDSSFIYLEQVSTPPASASGFTNYFYTAYTAQNNLAQNVFHYFGATSNLSSGVWMVQGVVSRFDGVNSNGERVSANSIQVNRARPTDVILGGSTSDGENIMGENSRDCLSTPIARVVISSPTNMLEHVIRIVGDSDTDMSIGYIMGMKIAE